VIPPCFDYSLGLRREFVRSELLMLAHLPELPVLGGCAFFEASHDLFVLPALPISCFSQPQIPVFAEIWPHEP
jgi:hypothetical protein